ncbi:MAG: hypothetical protein ACR2J3_08985 [Aridibacter sp.]
MKTKLKEFRDPQSDTHKTCVACGSAIEREDAKYCLVCGKVLSEDYQPLDTLRSSYRLQGKSFLVENAKAEEEITDLFAINRNPISEMAWASFVYSMVPFLGVLFIPVTFVIGIYGFGVSLRHPKAGGKQLSLISMGLSFPVLGIQIFFWWLLYIIPELAGRV